MIGNVVYYQSAASAFMILIVLPCLLLQGIVSLGLPHLHLHTHLLTPSQSGLPQVISALFLKGLGA